MEDRYFTRVPSPEDKEGWLGELMSESSIFKATVEAIANELECGIEDLGFCSLYESDFTDSENRGVREWYTG